MKPAESLAKFEQDPIGTWVVAAPTVLVWCATPELCGAIVWGRPSAADAEAMIAAFRYRHPKLAPRFDVVLDGSEIEFLDPDALAVLFTWLRERRDELVQRIRIQIGVVSDALPSLTLTGILPVLGETHAFQLSRDRHAAITSLVKDGGAVADAIEAALVAVRGDSHELRRLRELLRAEPVGATIADSAQRLGISSRTLQRILQASGTSFRDELRAARLAAALPLLVHGETKIAAVASRVGLSERALIELVRDERGTTPSGLRKKP